MRKFFPALLLACIFYVSVAHAEPAVTVENLKGLWEAVQDKEMRVIRFEIRNEKEGYLLVARHPEGFWAFRLREVKVSGSEVEMSFGIENGQAKAEVKGKVSVSGESGTLVGQLAMDPDPEKQSSLGVEFVKLPKDYKDAIEPNMNIPGKPAEKPSAVPA